MTQIRTLALATTLALASPMLFAQTATTLTPPKDRISDVGPWYAIDGTTLLFDNKAGLTGAPKAFIRMYEDGTEFDSTSDRLDLWTGTTSAGAATANHCTSWTFDTDNSAAGTSGCDNSLAEWTSCTISDLSCDSNAHLYCFEQ
mgnify:CR=1 FL=1